MPCEPSMKKVEAVDLKPFLRRIKKHRFPFANTALAWYLFLYLLLNDKLLKTSPHFRCDWKPISHIGSKDSLFQQVEEIKWRSV